MLTIAVFGRKKNQESRTRKNQEHRSKSQNEEMDRADAENLEPQSRFWVLDS